MLQLADIQFLVGLIAAGSGQTETGDGIWESFDLSILVAALALVVSIASAWLSHRTSAKALAIAERHEASQEPGLRVELRESRRWPSEAERNSHVGVEIQIANPSSRPTAVARVELLVDFQAGDSTTKLALAPSFENFGSLGEARRIDENVRLEPYDTELGWFIFELLPAFVGLQSPTESQLVLTDIHGDQVDLRILSFDTKK